MMSEFIFLYICSLLLVYPGLQFVSCSKKSWRNKSIKKLSKSEVEVKTYMFPCSFDEGKMLNSTFGTNRNHLHNCKRKFVIRMTVNSGGEYCSKTDGFIPIDHVIDGITGRKKRLLNPFMIRIKREKMFQLYDLQLVKTVNAEAREEVINYENTPNFTGCDTSSSHPTCGFSFFNNKIIQFSEGFCCSCDQNKNDERQPCEGHLHESKDFPDMQYAVHHQRSNRTSRDLETLESNLGVNIASGKEIDLTGDKSKVSKQLGSPEIPKSRTELDTGMPGNIALQENVDSRESEDNHNTFVSKDGLLLNKHNNFNPSLNSDFFTNNITIKSFEFQHSPKINNDHLYTVSALDTLIDSEDYSSGKRDKYKYTVDANNTLVQNIPVLLKTLNEEGSGSLIDTEDDINEKYDQYKHIHNMSTSSSIDRDSLKLLLMKRIKENKNREKTLMSENDTTKSSHEISIRDLTTQSNFSAMRIDKKSPNKGFSLKIQNDNSELSLQIVTKKPKGAFVFEGKSNESRFECVTANTCKTSKTKKNSKDSIKERIVKNPIVKYFQSSKLGKAKKSTSTEKPTPLVSCKNQKLTSSNRAETSECNNISTNQCATTLKTTKILSECGSATSVSNTTPGTNIDEFSKFNLTTNTTNIENLMYKLVPLINTVQNTKMSNNETCKTMDGIVANTVNATYNIYIEMRKKPNEINSHPSDIFQNEPDSFHLQNEVRSNNLDSSGEYKFIRVDNELNEEPLEYPGNQMRKNILDSDAFQSSHLNHYHKQTIQKREAACETQIRGGQSCSQKDKDIPCYANPETYFESAHCLRFSDLWYNVLKLFNPRLENSITVKIYAKHKTPDKRICWENLSKRLPGRVGTINEVLTDDAKNLMITYSSDDKVAFNLDCASDYILAPQALPKRCKDNELKTLICGGPEEYLVLKENEITFDGEECDKAGVNYAAFARQLHRCQQEPGACLKNQPLHYWREDKKSAKAGKRGQYFLSNFIEVTEQAILQNTTSNQVVLRAPYTDRYQSQVVVEMNADHIEIVGDKSEGQITEVYTDAVSERVTVVKAVITNLGIAADLFGVDFANCSSRLGPSDFDKPGKDEIPPQHRITYTATISSPLKQKRVECKLVLYNVDQEVVASRNIIIVQGHRCMCVWYCQCVCYDYPHPGLPCDPLSLKDYNRAGFPGHLPITIGSDCSTLFTVLHALLWFFFFLLLFGLIKALLGLCCPSIAVWGLWYLLPDEARCLYGYMEPHLGCYSIIRDCDGFPIHPCSYKRNVHFLPWYTEFAVNVFFFVCVPRSCFCERLCHRGSDMGFSYQHYQSSRCYSRPKGRAKCATGCSTRHRSPCGSVCSKRRNRKFRLSAGAEEDFLNPDPQTSKDEEMAQRLVDELTRSYVVFRVLSRPLGGVKSVPGAPYCVRGFFLESENGVYVFTPPSPLMQICQMDGSPLDPPVRLDPTPFHAIYQSAQEVLAAHELSPWARGVVINAP